MKLERFGSQKRRLNDSNSNSYQNFRHSLKSDCLEIEYNIHVVPTHLKSKLIRSNYNKKIRAFPD